MKVLKIFQYVREGIKKVFEKVKKTLSKTSKVYRKSFFHMNPLTYV